MKPPATDEANKHCAGRVNEQADPPAWFYRKHSADFVVNSKKSAEKTETGSSRSSSRSAAPRPSVQARKSEGPPRGSVGVSVAQAHMQSIKPAGVWVDAPFEDATMEDNVTGAPHLSPSKR